MQIMIYSKNDCPRCDEARNFLDHLKISYNSKTIGIDINREEVQEKCPTAKMAPAVTVNEKYIGSLEELKDFVAATVPTTVSELLGLLYRHICEVTFEKQDGTIRRMKCTIALTVIPTDKWPQHPVSDRSSDNHIKVWDLEEEDWRSFNYDSVKFFEVF